jgi:hypothetical protein
MTVSLESEAKVRLRVHLPVSSQKSVNFEPQVTLKMRLDLGQCPGPRPGG